MKKILTIRLRCRDFPGKQFGGYAHVFLGVQKDRATIWQTPGDAVETLFDIPVAVSEGKDGKPHFSGPFVHGKPGGKFLYLVWLNKKDSHDEMFRRAKIMLQHLSWGVIEQATEQDRPLIADITLTGSKGDPVCGSLKPANIQWRENE